MSVRECFTLPALSGRQREHMLQNALQVLDAQRQMTTSKGRNILHYTLRRKRRHVKLQHYPKGDRIDYDTGAQYFYHCHREDVAREEHGHFHCFLRYTNIPKHIKPAPLPDWDKHTDNPMAHIAAIAMNRYGQPIRLFTVNRWVSFETWYDATHVPEFIKQFSFTLVDDPYWPVLDRWVEGMLHLFAPQIAWLHRERDQAIANWQRKHPTINAYEDHRLEELSAIPMNLAAQVQWIMRA